MRDAQRFVIELEKNLEDRKKQTKGILDVFIQKEWDKQVSSARLRCPFRIRFIPPRYRDLFFSPHTHSAAWMVCCELRWMRRRRVRLQLQRLHCKRQPWWMPRGIY
jgi:hypothetical protein